MEAGTWEDVVVGMNVNVCVCNNGDSFLCVHQPMTCPTLLSDTPWGGGGGGGLIKNNLQFFNQK
jgi:hypothetical protein